MKLEIDTNNITESLDNEYDTISLSSSSDRINYMTIPPPSSPPRRKIFKYIMIYSSSILCSMGMIYLLINFHKIFQ